MLKLGDTANGKPCTPPGMTFNAANNRIAADGLHIYDNNVSGGPGNLTADGTHGYVYDLENRIACVGVDINGNCTTTSAYYFYDPQGQRAGKQQGQTMEDYVYDLGGHQISAHDASANLLRAELFGGGRHVASWNPSANYGPLFFNHEDWLGTHRVRTDSTGTAREWCSDTPYGMNLACSPGDTSPMHFTGLQYDPETGMSHTLHRQFPMYLGRWLTADPAGLKAVHFEDPQTWNIYAYVRNNPIRLTDPSGLDTFLVLYTTGNSEGQAEIQRAAETRASDIESNKHFNSKRDRVILQGVKTRDDFVNALKVGTEAAKQSGPIRTLDLISHSGKDGPVFHEDSAITELNPHGGVQLSTEQVKNLPQLSWATAAHATFDGCRTTQFASQFAQDEHVTSFGNPGYANFSSYKFQFSPDAGGSLYLKSFWFGGVDLGRFNPSHEDEYDAK